MATGKTDLPIPELDTEQLEQLAARLAAERERRNAEWVQERLDAGRVVKLVAEPGEVEADAIARRRAEHPEEDCWYIVRVCYDAPPPLPFDGRPPPEPAAPVEDPWGEPEPTRPIPYPPQRGWM